MSSEQRLKRLGLQGTPDPDLPAALSSAERAAQERSAAAHQRWRQENPEKAAEYDRRMADLNKQ